MNELPPYTPVAITIPTTVDCTSCTITPCGTLLISTFSNGTVMAFGLVTGKGVEVANIKAKGLHTNLIMHSCVSDDCRFAFSGVLRGSVDMIAIDVSNGFYLNGAGGVRSGNIDANRYFKTYRHSDAKLKGLGACKALNNGKYALFCGRGIKNVHVWIFTPPADGNGGKERWECVLDAQTNGMTIEYVMFRYEKEKLYGVSKSDSSNLRVWDLDKYTKGGGTEGTTDKSGDYVDVKGTEDAVGVFGGKIFIKGGEGVGIVEFPSLLNGFQGITSSFPSSPRHELEIPSPPPNLCASSNCRSSGGKSKPLFRACGGDACYGGNAGFEYGAAFDAVKKGAGGNSLSRRKSRAYRTVKSALGLETCSKVLLELSDGSVTVYTESSLSPTLQPCTSCYVDNDVRKMKDDRYYVAKMLDFRRVGRDGVEVVTRSCFDGREGKGYIHVRPVVNSASASEGALNVTTSKSDWGWDGRVKFKVQPRSAASKNEAKEDSGIVYVNVTETPGKSAKQTKSKSSGGAGASGGVKAAGRKGRESPSVDEVGAIVKKQRKSSESSSLNRSPRSSSPRSFSSVSTSSTKDSSSVMMTPSSNYVPKSSLNHVTPLSNDAHGGSFDVGTSVKRAADAAAHGGKHHGRCNDRMGTPMSRGKVANNDTGKGNIISPNPTSSSSSLQSKVPSSSRKSSSNNQMCPSSSPRYRKNTLTPWEIEKRIKDEIDKALVEYKREPKLSVVDGGWDDSIETAKTGTENFVAFESAVKRAGDILKVRVTFGYESQVSLALPSFLANSPSFFFSKPSPPPLSSATSQGSANSLSSHYPLPPLPPSMPVHLIHKNECVSLLRDFHSDYLRFVDQITFAAGRVKAERLLAASYPNMKFVSGVSRVKNGIATTDMGHSKRVQSASSAKSLVNSSSACVSDVGNCGGPNEVFHSLRDAVELRTIRNSKIDELVTSHKQVLEEMLSRQRMEADALAGKQSMSVGERVQPVSVDFPYWDIFKRVKRDLGGVAS